MPQPEEKNSGKEMTIKIADRAFLLNILSVSRGREYHHFDEYGHQTMITPQNR